MNAWLQTLVEKTAQLLDRPRSAAGNLSVEPDGAVVIGRQTDVTIIRPEPAAVVEAVRRAAWDAKGWTRQRQIRGCVYTGTYQVADRRSGAIHRYLGRIVDGADGPAAYIADPPQAIKQHPKGPCFTLANEPWFRLHWHRAPQDVDHAILYVETILDESLNR